MFVQHSFQTDINSKYISFQDTQINDFWTDIFSYFKCKQMYRYIQRVKYFLSPTKYQIGSEYSEIEKYGFVERSHYVQ